MENACNAWERTMASGRGKEYAVGLREGNGQVCTRETPRLQETAPRATPMSNGRELNITRIAMVDCVRGFG